MNMYTTEGFIQIEKARHTMAVCESMVSKGYHEEYGLQWHNLANQLTSLGVYKPVQSIYEPKAQELSDAYFNVWLEYACTGTVSDPLEGLL